MQQTTKSAGDIGDFKQLLGLIASGVRLDVGQAEQAFDIMMSGNATPSQMGGFLMGLRVRGETVAEITGGARAMRAKALTIVAPPDAIDTCGTGGDASGTWNVSTAAAFVLAALGVPVAKHGNRALSSQTGAADVLAALGVKIDCDLALVQRSLAEAGFGFLMAPRHHGAMRHVGPTRVELGTRTIFNLLGPLSNPGGTRRQLIGVFARQWVRPIAEVCRELGAERVWVVHGEDGLDEITTTGRTFVAALENGSVQEFELTPEQAGLNRSVSSALKGADPATNARALENVLKGEPGAFRDIVLLNAGAALVIAGRAPNVREGAQLAATAIDSGAALRTLRKVVAITNDMPHG